MHGKNPQTQGGGQYFLNGGGEDFLNLYGASATSP